MVDLKIEIGKKIKTMRMARGWTQADLCGDETELTIRQLARIENGQAMPTIPKLVYLAQQLDVNLQDLVDLATVELPKKYLALKNRLIRYHTYGDPDRIAQQEQIFDEIYDEFYDNLPEEEQLSVEILQVHANVFSSLDVGFGLSLLEEYFQQVLKKNVYSSNDLLIINVYFLCCAVGLEDKEYFEELSNRILLSIDYSDLNHLYLLERIIISILAQTDYRDYLPYIKTLREIIEESKNYQHKPSVYAFEAKYFLEIEGDKEKMIESYDKAILFAKMLNDDILVKKLELEKEKDLAT